jgi:death-on-curing family protein
MKHDKKILSSEPPKGSVEIYKDPQGGFQLEVKLEKETVWLTQKQIALLFGTQRPAITKHLANIFKSGELEEDSVCSILEHTAKDGKIYKTKFYNLDMVISVGYRVNSQRATQFRIWATRVLKDYLLQGYAINQKKLLEQHEKFKELQQAINFMQKKAKISLLQHQSQELLNILNIYAQSLSLLYQYDEGKLNLHKRKKPVFILDYHGSKSIIEVIKKELESKGEASTLFGREAENKFKSVVGALYQTFGRHDLYRTVEEKAAHLLYLTIKSHPFVDGNKRIASFLFVYFLDKNNYLWKKSNERKITDTTLVALALLVAESEPKEKDVMIKLITNLLKD